MNNQQMEIGFQPRKVAARSRAPAKGVTKPRTSSPLSGDRSLRRSAIEQPRGRSVMTKSFDLSNIRSRTFKKLRSRTNSRIIRPARAAAMTASRITPVTALNWMVKLDAAPEGGIAFDTKFFMQPEDYRIHQIRLEGGDSSSDSFCYP